ncbi:MAG: LysR family transcriptional regulator [Oscillospiraceae bacterium]|nr:LysR family transcriptional regulator [Oscillospiraceae bacterium]
MELRLLEYFLTVVREEIISRAAEVLHVTQPTLSRQMKELEDELHTTLFIRGKRLTLTDSGVMLRRCAEEDVTFLYDPAKLTFRPLTPELSFTSVLAWKKLSPYSGAAGKFLEYIKSVHADHLEME